MEHPRDHLKNDFVLDYELKAIHTLGVTNSLRAIFHHTCVGLFIPFYFIISKILLTDHRIKGCSFFKGQKTGEALEYDMPCAMYPPF